MKILLINEASGVHRNLRFGLEDLGCTVSHRVLSQLPGRNDYDGAFSRNRSGILGKISRNVEPLINIAALPKYDVISFCNSITAVHGLYSKYLDLPILRKKASILSYYGLGCDEIGMIRKSQSLPYTPCATCLKSGEVLGQDCEKFLYPRYDRSKSLVSRYFDFGASSAIEYDHVSVAFSGKPFSRIPFPVRTEHIPFIPAEPRRLVRIVHTPTRRGFKGTDQVLQAIQILSGSRNDFDFSIIEGLRYEEYLTSIRESDIVIDQVYSQSSGINALEMLALGKIVLSGSTYEGRSYFGQYDHPAFDASPTPEVLARTISELLDRRNEFFHMAERGRNFVESFHNPTKIAKMFLDSWELVKRRADTNIEGHRGNS